MAACNCLVHNMAVAVHNMAVAFLHPQSTDLLVMPYKELPTQVTLLWAWEVRVRSTLWSTHAIRRRKSTRAINRAARGLYIYRDIQAKPEAVI